MSIIVNPIQDIFVRFNSPNTTINLFNNFDDPLTTGKVANFNLVDNTIGNGEINIVLFDQAGQGAPITVENFTNYANNGLYVNSIIHRSITNFVIQGGGFTFNNLTVGNVPTFAPIVNEFSPNRSNVQGTIAMAKQGGNPNSATSQWFFNLGDNSANLDNQNEGFTVFGQVLSSNDSETISAIASLPVRNGQSINPAFTDLPLNVDPNNIRIDQDDDLVRFANISVNSVPELNFTVVNNTNPDLVTVNTNNGILELDYSNTVSGTAEITVQATNLLGQSVSDTFQVSVSENNDDENSELLNRLNTPLFRFQNRDIPGTYLFATAGERESIIANFPQFIEEGFAFRVASEPGDRLIAFNRFRNSDVLGTYLYASPEESANIRQNFPNFIDEGVAFYAYGANSFIADDFFRFQNSQQPGTYIFVGEEERQNIINNFSQFIPEGVAFEVGI